MRRGCPLRLGKVLGLALVLGVLPSCAGSRRGGPDLPGDGYGGGGEWMSATFAGIERQPARGDGVSDSFGLGLAGGIGLTQGSKLDLSWEFLGSVSEHDTDAQPTDGEDNIRVWRAGTGLRLRLQGLGRFIPYVHAGGFFRAVDDDMRPDAFGNPSPEFGGDGFGRYFGGGLDLRMREFGSMGVFGTYYEDFDNELEELQVGISAFFSF